MEAAPYVAPDELFLVFLSLKTRIFSDANLYILFKKDDGAWSRRGNLAKALKLVNDDISAIRLSPDEKYLFVLGHSDIYWVDASILKDIRAA